MDSASHGAIDHAYNKHMPASLALSLTLLLTPQTKERSFDEYIEDLLRWRIQFEKVLAAPADYAYHTVGSETLGGAHGEAFYPVGSASERYMLSFNGDLELIYQKRRGNQAVAVWRLPCLKSKSKSPVRGTIPKYLQRIGYRISPKAQLTAAMRSQLAKTGHFATYTYHHMQGGYASVVRPDGTATKANRHDDVFMITPEEKALLRAKLKK